MKKFINIIALLLSVCIISCEDDAKDNIGPELKIIDRNVDITAAGGNVTVNLSIEGEKAISDQDWCTVALSGKVLTVTLEANTNIEGRTAMITVIKGEEKVFFPVTQPSNIVPRSQIENAEFDAHGGTLRIPVDKAAPFKAQAEDGATWLDVKVDGDCLVLTTQKNYTLDVLSAKVKLTSGTLESEMMVTQTGIVLIPEKTDLAMYYAGDEVTLKVNSTLAFKALSDKDWLKVTIGDGTVTLVAEDNSEDPTARTAIITLTSEALTSTIKVVQRLPAYTDYLGKWTLVGLDGDAPFEYKDLSIVQATSNSTYEVTGWGKSIVAVDEKYALIAKFNEKTGMITISAQENRGVYTDAKNEVFDVMFYGLIKYGTGFSYVTGGYVCYSGMMQRDGSVQWQNGSVILAGGAPYDLVGAKYYIKSRTSGSALSFTVDTPLMSNPVMTKNEDAQLVRSSLMRVGMNNATTIENNILYSK